MTRTLSERELNRALLARQLLLERAKTPLPRALERIGGIQAQYAPSMYIGLWSRLDGFERDQLTRALERRSVIQGSMMRATIHLVSKRDYWPFVVGIRRAQRKWWLRTHGRDLDAKKIAANDRKVRRAFNGGTLKRAELEEVVGTAARLCRSVRGPGSRAAVRNVGAPPRGPVRARGGLGRARVGDRGRGDRAARPPLPAGVRPRAPRRDRRLGEPRRDVDEAGARAHRAATLPGRAGQGARRPPAAAAARRRHARAGALPPRLGRDAARPRAAHADPPGALPLADLQHPEPRSP